MFATDSVSNCFTSRRTNLIARQLQYLHNTDQSHCPPTASVPTQRGPVSLPPDSFNTYITRTSLIADTFSTYTTWTNLIAPRQLQYLHNEDQSHCSPTASVPTQRGPVSLPPDSFSTYTTCISGCMYGCISTVYCVV